MLKQVSLIGLPLILRQNLLTLLILRTVLHRQRYGACLVIFLYISFSILLLEYIIHYSIGVQIPLCNHHGLQFEDVYFLDSKSNLLTWS
jgi:hypothetical protein